MKRILFGALIGFVIGGLGVGTMLFAQERGTMGAGKGPLIVLAGLKLEEGADVEAAEGLLKDKLSPAMTDIEGLEMRVLKRMKMPGAQPSDTDSGAYDYIMAAEIEKLQVFMQLMRGGSSEMSDFGDMMKKHAGHPYINVYTILAKTEKTK